MGFFKKMKEQYTMYADALAGKNTDNIDIQKNLKDENEKLCNMDADYNSCPFINEDKKHCDAAHNMCYFMKKNKEKNSFIENYYKRFE